MKEISTLKRFSNEELIQLLCACSESLAVAYQNSLDKDFWHIAIQARLACESLRYEIHSQTRRYPIH